MTCGYKSCCCCCWSIRIGKGRYIYNQYYTSCLFSHLFNFCSDLTRYFSLHDSIPLVIIFVSISITRLHIMSCREFEVYLIMIPYLFNTGEATELS